MPEEISAQPVPNAPALATPDSAAPGPSSIGPTINIGDEFGTAKRNLPPTKILLLAIAAVVVVVAIASFLQRAKPQGSGSLDHVVAIAIPGQTSTMAALTFTLKNGDATLYVHDIHGSLKTGTQELSAEAVSAIDFDRYFQAFPELKEGVKPPMPPETRLQPAESVSRSVIVVFPVALADFNQRMSIGVVIQPYDQQVPIVLTR